MDFEEILGKEIKQLRADSGFTQAQLASKTGLDVQYISKIERGEKIPRWNTLLKICHALNSTMGGIVLRAEEQLKL